MSEQMWNEAQSIITATENHTFLTSMVDGTLSKEKFVYYVKQDAIYLNDYAECLSRLSEKCPNQTHAKRLKEMAKGAEKDEKDMHRSFFKKWKINDDEEVKAMPNTLLYTSYILRIVSLKPYAEGLAVLLPCFWVYMHVGKKMLNLRKALGDSVSRSPEFDAWIDMYASDEFEKDVTDYRSIVDDFVDSSDCDEGMIKKMKHHFVRCCQLEHMFWDQAEELIQWPGL